MIHRAKRILIVTVATLVAFAIPIVEAPHASAAPIVDPSQWRAGDLSFNTRQYCDGFCLIYTLAMNNVDVQRPQGNPNGYPRVGERFYVHIHTAVVFPLPVDDSYRMDVLLPDGLRMDVRSDTDVMCTITDTAFNDWRSMGPGECLDPVKVGVYWRFPAVALTNNEVANFFFPVVADRTFAAGDGQQEIGLVSDLIGNPWTALPDPLYATNDFRVDAAPPTVPSAPRSVVATGGDARAVVRWTAPVNNGGRAITGYTARAIPGGRTCSTTGAATCTVTGLTNGTAYRFSVTARNVVGTSAVSALSTAVVPRTVPGPVRGLRVTKFPAKGKASLSWSTPAVSGGAAVTGYRLRRSAAGGSSYGAWANVPATNRTVASLKKRKKYRVQVVAVNAAGPSLPATVTFRQRK